MKKSSKKKSLDAIGRGRFASFGLTSLAAAILAAGAANKSVASDPEAVASDAETVASDAESMAHRRPPPSTLLPTVNVPKAACQREDNPETGFQGQVPAAMRVPGGFKGFNCNLQLVSQSRNDGASWQHAWFSDGKHDCEYYDTASNTVGRSHLGVVTIDATDPISPIPTAFLTSTSMLDPWESLKVNDRRQLLGAVSATNGNGGPQIDLYDISGDCRHPQLLSSFSVGTPEANAEFGTPIANPQIRGHEGSFSPDGLTYYGTDLFPGYIYPMDISDTLHPKMLAQWFTNSTDSSIFQATHGLSISEDGNRAYFTIFGSGGANTTGAAATNAFIIADVSDVQNRQPNPQLKIISLTIIPDGSAAQHTIPIKVHGKPYVVEVDEGGAGGNSMTGWTNACTMRQPPWNMARIFDVKDERHPVLVSEMRHEINLPQNCASVIPDLAGISGFTYGSHYCSVDNKKDATTLVCGYFESGIRVFDIRDPANPREIAYFNPPSVTTPSPGSQNNKTAANGRPDHCSSQSHLDAKRGMLYVTCQDNGFYALKFEHGVWPFPTSKTPPGESN
jgi:hypothetical protein